MSRRSDEYRGSRSRRPRATPPRTGKILIWTLGACGFIIFLGCGVVVYGIIAGVNWVDKKLDEAKEDWSGPPLLVTHPKKEGVVGVAYSPDGGQIASSGSSGTVWIWNAETGASVLSIDAGKGPHRWLAFSPDGTRLAIGGTIWDVATGKKLISLNAWVIAFSPDGTQVASPSDASTARVWDAKTGKELLVLTGHSNAVSCVAFSPDGSRLVTGLHDDTVRLWDAATGKEVRKIEFRADKSIVQKDRDDIKVDKPIVQKDPVLCQIQFSSDGKQVWGVSRSDFWTWDAATGETIRSTRINFIDKEGDQFAIHSGSNQLARAFDYRVTVWDLSTGASTHQVRSRSVTLSFGPDVDRLLCVGFNSDGTRMVGGGGDGAIRVWKLDK